MIRTRIAPSLAAAVLLAATSAVSLAQGTGRSMDMDLSVRSAAMGGASTALFWGEEQNHWANPALLSETRGIRYEHGRTQLVPGLADDVFLTSDVLKLGGSGAGVVLSSDLPGGVDLDYGLSEGRDESGTPTGTFWSFETVDSWGFGVSPVRLAEALSRQEGRVSRYFDVAIGMNQKHVVIQLAPSSLGGRATGDCSDAGLFARFTPVDLLRSRAALPVRIDLTCAVRDRPGALRKPRRQPGAREHNRRQVTRPRQGACARRVAGGSRPPAAARVSER